MQLGVNDSCPCASGKKYKKCCLPFGYEQNGWFKYGPPKVIEARIAETLSVTGLNFLMEKVLKELPNFMGKVIQQFFFGKDINQVDIDDQARHFLLLSLMQNWTHKNMNISNTGHPQTMLSFALKNAQGQLPDNQLKFLQSFQNTYYSFYTLVEQLSKYEFIVKDILLGKTFKIFETQLFNSIQKGDAFYTQLIEYDDINMIFGCYPFPLRTVEHIQLIDWREKIKKTIPLTETSLRDTLDDKTREWYFNVTIFKEKGFFRNTDDEKIEFYKVKYKIKNLSWDVLQKLAPLTCKADIVHAAYDIVRHPDGGFKELSFDWIVKGNPIHVNWPYTNLGTMKILWDELTIEVNSKERAERFKTFMAENLDGDMKFVSMRKVVALNTQILETEKKTGKDLVLDVGGFVSDDELTEAKQKELMAKAQNDYYANWLDMPLPLLNNITPRQASKDPAMQEKLEILLLGFEKGEGEECVVDVEKLRIALKEVA